jgi:hypothetical protein
MRRRIATEGGDEHIGVKGGLSVRAPASRTGSNGGNHDPSSGHSPMESVGTRPPRGRPPSSGLRHRAPAMMCLSSPNAAQRAGASQRKVVTSTPVSRGCGPVVGYRGNKARQHVRPPRSSRPSGNDPHRHARGERRDQVRAHSKYTCPPSSPSAMRPFIGERDATRGRSATEGGDERANLPRWNDTGPVTLCLLISCA